MTDTLCQLIPQLLKPLFSGTVEVEASSATIYLNKRPHNVFGSPINNGDNPLIPNPFFQCVIPKASSIIHKREVFLFCFSQSERKNPEMLRILENLRRQKSNVSVIIVSETAIDIFQKQLCSAKIAIVDTPLLYLFTSANNVASFYVSETLNHTMVKSGIRKLIGDTPRITNELKLQQKMSRSYFDKFGDPRLVNTPFIAMIFEITHETEYLLRSLLFVKQLYCRIGLLPTLRKILHFLELDHYYDSVNPIDDSSLSYLELSLLL